MMPNTNIGEILWFEARICVWKLINVLDLLPTFEW